MQLLGLLDFTTGKVRASLGLQTIRPKSSDLHAGLEDIKELLKILERLRQLVLGRR